MPRATNDGEKYNGVSHVRRKQIKIDTAGVYA